MRWGRLLGRLFLAALAGIALLSLGLYGTVHHTAQPEFCNSCHIMEPYYESWRTSAHADIGCIECHYEPGVLETLEGKFKALSQLAKYVTRTEGTKPWAEVSDQSCMRTGCHSVRMLEGTVSFGKVKFDHRHHLLESRRGRRLQCVTCHSQIVQGDHVSVTPSVCNTCHFMPDSHGQVPAKTGDCLMCHGPPHEEILVEGRPFVHADYVRRGVDCRECHDPVIEGDGAVRRERCHSCHSEIGHIERLHERDFLHEMHVTEHKVECFECHDEIRHGLLELRPPKPARGEGCGSCHMSSHDAVADLYSGTGAIGVPDRPSRMYQTRVVCRACHTGRSGVVLGHGHARIVEASFARDGKLPRASSESPAHPVHGPTVAAAGNVDCLHCHGVEFDGMLAEWQAAVDAGLQRLQPLVTELGAELSDLPEHPARVAYAEAKHNIELVTLDGSRGAHNVTYALDVLRVSAARIGEARQSLGMEGGDDLAATLPFVSREGCSTCHLAVESSLVAQPAGGFFPHEPHLRSAALECSTCHSLEDHGSPAPDRADCATCHHSGSAAANASDCSACHGPQTDMLAGTVSGHPALPAVMAEMTCDECHGEAPEILRPGPGACVLCHEKGFDQLMLQWQAAVGGRIGRLRATLEELDAHPRAGDPAVRELLEKGRSGLAAVERDGSLGTHNVHLAIALLQSASEALDRASREVGARSAVLSEPTPFHSEEGCVRCHAGLETHTTLRPDGRSFPHGTHVERAGMECGACHSLEVHGEPAFPRAQCATCHHQEPAVVHDAGDCTSCHAAQERMILGEVEGFPESPGAKADIDCSTCHGEIPDVAMPDPSLCRVCHGATFKREMPGVLAEIDALRERVARSLAERSADDDPDMRLARRALQAVVEDASRGVHNSEFTRLLLTEALRLSAAD